jgi:hypothetical protein
MMACLSSALPIIGHDPIRLGTIVTLVGWQPGLLNIVPFQLSRPMLLHEP